MNHPYVGLHGKFPAYESPLYPSCSHPEFVGVVAHGDAATGQITLLADGGEHMMKHISFLVLTDPPEARRRLTEQK